MSIHQSKGLEFPVAVVADLGKPFNLADLNSEIILDEEYGLCPQIKPPHTGKRYPSLPYWLARRRQRSELLGEELRLLYVAMTRARDLLLLTGALTKGSFEKQWLATAPEAAPTPPVPRRYTDWLAAWFARHAGAREPEAREGACSLLNWFLHEDANLAQAGPRTEESLDVCPIDFESDTWRQLEQRLSWKYPFVSATTQPAKTSASLLRRQTAAADPDESAPLFPRQG